MQRRKSLSLNDEQFPTVRESRWTVSMGFQALIRAVRRAVSHLLATSEGKDRAAIFFYFAVEISNLP